MRLRPACSWCRTHEGFIENPGLRILVLCFKKMCQYINSSAIGREIRRAATNTSHTNTLIRVLDEAAAFQDDYVIENKVMPTCAPSWGMAPEPKLVSLNRGGASQQSSVSSSQIQSSSAVAQQPVTTSVAPATSTTPAKRKRRDSAASAQSQNDIPPKLIVEKTDETEKVDVVSSMSTKLEDDLDLMPALLAPCTRGIISQEKLSPPLPSSRADVHEEELGSSTWPEVRISLTYL